MLPKPRRSRRVLTLPEIAKYLQCSLRSVQRRMNDPVDPLPVYRLRGPGRARGSVRGRTEAIDAWLERRAS